MTQPRRRFARPELAPIADLQPHEECACRPEIVNADGHIVQRAGTCVLHAAMQKRDAPRPARTPRRTNTPGVRRPVHNQVSNAAERRAAHNQQSEPRSKRRSGNGYQKDAA